MNPLAAGPISGVASMLSHPFIQHAFLAGTAIALLSGLVGYFVVLRGQVFAGDALSHVAYAGALAALAAGVELDDGLTAPARVRRLEPSRVELVIHEGRKHQVKRMLEAVGHPVRRLHRSRYAGLTVEGLEPGAWRELTGDELAALKELTRRT